MRTRFPAPTVVVLSGATLLAIVSGARAQNLAPPVAAWQAWDPGSGKLVEPRPDGDLFRPADPPGVLGVRGKGSGSVFWRTATLPLEAGGTYSFRFRARGSGSGLIISGPSGVNHDFQPPGDWKDFAFSFRLPDEAGSDWMRLGQWELNGQLEFSDPELYPVRPIHRSFGGGLVLGHGELLEPGRYADSHQLGWSGTTIHRTLWRQRAFFNAPRFCFGDGSEVVYRHELPFPLLGASLRLNLNYRTGGKLIVEASPDGEAWTPVAEASAVGGVAADIPAAAFPSRALHVRLRGAGDAANLQVNEYRLEARVEYAGPTRRGDTWCVEELQTEPGLDFCPDPDWRVAGYTDGRRDLELRVEVDGRPATVENPTVTPMGGTGSAGLEWQLPGALAGPGRHELAIRLEEGGRTVYRSRVEVVLGTLDERGYGQPLPGGGPGLALWWCDGARKVARDCPPPAGAPQEAAAAAIRIEAARGEWEPAQLVLRAGEKDAVLEAATAGDLRGEKGSIPASAVRLLEVATVRVEQPTDAAGGPGDYPDPLPPLDPPLRIPAGQNQAIWVLVRVPDDAAAGVHRGAIRLRVGGREVSVPLEVRVFDFALPRSTRLRGGFGLDPGLIRRYHGLTSDAQLRTVYDLYLRSFAEHRIMPYSFFALDPIRLRWEGEGAARRPVVDFSAFDRAAGTWLERRGATGGGAGESGAAAGREAGATSGGPFNSFSLPVEGLGGGTFHSRHPGEFGGFRVGTEEYERLMADYLGQLERHLKGNGWLDAAYVYWFDEPDPKDYPFVVDVMQRMRRHAPGLRRMLTEQPEPELLGNVEIWCGLTPEWSPAKVAERRKAGEEVWWYLCTGPKAPYVGIFIDHPALEMRLWAWQSWQYGVEGLLVWQTNYWHSDPAFPDSLQDPWKDPMSYTSGYDTPRGARLPWGNGDGRFLYPPRRDPNAGGPPVVAPPISSIRWENLRDGIEDHEYLAMLRDLCRSKAGPAADEAAKLLAVPEEISRDLTRFTTEPGKVLDHRRRVAEAIERLGRK